MEVLEGDGRGEEARELGGFGVVGGEGDALDGGVVDHEAGVDVLIELRDERGAVGRARAGDVDVVHALAVAAREHDWLVIGMREGKKRCARVPSAVRASTGRDPELGDERGIDVAADEGKRMDRSSDGGAGEESGGELHDAYRGCAKECREGGPIELSSRERRAQASSLEEQGKAKAKA